MIAEQFDAFFLDLDGVVYLGEEPVPRSVESVTRLYEMGKELRFLTNDPRPTRSAVLGNLEGLNIDARKDEIITASWATARYLSDRDVSSAAVVGSEGLEVELDEEGIEVTDTDPEAMVVGAAETTSYHDIRRAVRHIDRGALFVGTNPDGSFPTPAGPAPGAGAIVRAVEEASGTEPTIIGKPEPLMFQMALTEIADDRGVVVVGDNPATDILGAHRSGLTGVLVADEEPTASSARDFRHPEATVGTLADLFSNTAGEWERPRYPWPADIRPGVGGIIVTDRDEVLLLKRSDTGRWALPTGTVERGESVEAAIRREMREELDLQISVEKLTGVYSRPEQQVFSYPSGKAVHFITTCFGCAIDSGAPKADQEEALDVGFFAIDDLPSNTLSMHPQWITDAIDQRGHPAVR